MFNWWTLNFPIYYSLKNNWNVNFDIEFRMSKLIMELNVFIIELILNFNFNVYWWTLEKLIQCI